MPAAPKQHAHHAEVRLISLLQSGLDQRTTQFACRLYHLFFQLPWDSSFYYSAQLTMTSGQRFLIRCLTGKLYRYSSSHIRSLCGCHIYPA